MEKRVSEKAGGKGPESPGFVKEDRLDKKEPYRATAQGPAKNETEELRAAAQDYKETLQRLQAEFENFRKRNEKEKEEFRKLVNASLITDFLPLVDSVSAGIKQAEKAGNAEMKKGFESVQKQLMQILERNGVKVIESTGKKFDHDLHEVLMTDNEQAKEDGIVLEEFARGYTINGKVLRPAKVKVNKREQTDAKNDEGK